MSNSREQTLTIRIGSQVSEALTGINKIGDRVQKFGKDVARTGATLSRNITAPILAVGAAATAAAIRLGNHADTLLDLAQQTGLTTDTLQEFRRVAVVAGVGPDTLADAAMALTKRLKEAGDMSAGVQTALGRLGVETRTSTGELRSMDDMLPEVIHGLQGMDNMMARNSLATELFGGKASALAPVLGMTADQFEELRREAHAMGMVLDGDALNSADQFRVGVDSLKSELGNLGLQLGVAVMPVVNDLVNLVRDHVVPVLLRFVDWVKGLDGTLVRMVATIGGVVAAVGPMLLIFGKVVGVLAMVLSPAGLVIAAISTIATIAFVLVKNWDRFLLFWINLWGSLQEIVLGGVDKILGGFEALYGNIPGLGRLVSGLRDRFNDLADGAMANTEAAVERIRARMANATDGMVETVATAVELDVSLEELTTTTDRAGTAVGTMTTRSGDLRAALATVETGVVGVRESMDLVPMTMGRVTQSTMGSLQTVRDDLRRTADGGAKAFTDMERSGTAAMDALGQTVAGISRSAENAVVDAMFGASRGVRNFVSDALKQLARLAASQLFKKVAGFALGGAVGGPLGLAFAGMFADGGVIGAGRFGLVGEQGPEFISAGSAPLRITPMDAVGGGDAGAVASAILAGLGPPPAGSSPEVLALDSWYRRLFSAMAQDGRRRGVI